MEAMNNRATELVEEPGVVLGPPVGEQPAERTRRFPLGRVILRRILYLLLILWIVTVIVFMATQGLPGDTARAILGQNATPAQLETIQKSLGLNRPIPVQYFSWIGRALKGDLGTSLANKQEVSAYLGARFVNSLVMMLLACLFSIPLALLVGIVCAVRRGGILDRLVSGLSLVLTAIPPFVIGLAFILAFAISVFHWLPPVSLIEPGKSIWSQLDMVILPAVTLAVGVFPYVAYMIRGAMIEALDSAYVSVAHLNGIPQRRVIVRHALPNVIATTAQVIALQIGYLAGGAVAVETVYSFPGMGLALFGAIQYRDLPVIQILTVVMAAIYLLATVGADIVAILVTPRVRTGLR